MTIIIIYNLCLNIQSRIITSAALEQLRVLPCRICHGIWDAIENQIQKEYTAVQVGTFEHANECITHYATSSTNIEHILHKILNI